MPLPHPQSLHRGARSGYYPVYVRGEGRLPEARQASHGEPLKADLNLNSKANDELK